MEPVVVHKSKDVLSQRFVKKCKHEKDILRNSVYKNIDDEITDCN